MIVRMNDPQAHQWLALTTALDRAMQEHAPGWTDHSGHDPSITMLELMAYLLEEPQLRVDGSDARAAVLRLIRVLEPYRRSGPPVVGAYEQWGGVLRPRFFPNQILTADDLRDEQDYHREQHRRHVRTLHGWGIVDGLDLGVMDDDITIEPGYAIDASGQEICLHAKAMLTVPSNAPSPLVVVVQYAERLVRPVLGPSGDGTEPSRVEEGCKVLLVPTSADEGLAVARLVREGNAWRRDSSFVPTRLASATRRDR